MQAGAGSVGVECLCGVRRRALAKPVVPECAVEVAVYCGEVERDARTKFCRKLEPRLSIFFVDWKLAAVAAVGQACALFCAVLGGCVDLCVAAGGGKACAEAGTGGTGVGGA